MPKYEKVDRKANLRKMLYEPIAKPESITNEDHVSVQINNVEEKVDVKPKPKRKLARKSKKRSTPVRKDVLRDDPEVVSASGGPDAGDIGGEASSSDQSETSDEESD